MFVPSKVNFVTEDGTIKPDYHYKNVSNGWLVEKGGKNDFEYIFPIHSKIEIDE